MNMNSGVDHVGGCFSPFWDLGDYIVISAPSAITAQWKNQRERKSGLAFDIIDRERIQSCAVPPGLSPFGPLFVCRTRALKPRACRTIAWLSPKTLGSARRSRAISLPAKPDTLLGDSSLIKRSKLTASTHLNHTRHKITYIWNGIVYRKFYDAFTHFPLCAPYRIWVFRNPQKSIFVAAVRHRFCTTTVHWTKPNLVAIGAYQRLGIHVNNVVDLLAISARIEKP